MLASIKVFRFHALATTLVVITTPTVWEPLPAVCSNL